MAHYSFAPRRMNLMLIFHRTANSDGLRWSRMIQMHRTWIFQKLPTEKWLNASPALRATKDSAASFGTGVLTQLNGLTWWSGEYSSCEIHEYWWWCGDSHLTQKYSKAHVISWGRYWFKGLTWVAGALVLLLSLRKPLPAHASLPSTDTSGQPDMEEARFATSFSTRVPRIPASQCWRFFSFRGFMLKLKRLAKSTVFDLDSRSI